MGAWPPLGDETSLRERDPYRGPRVTRKTMRRRARGGVGEALAGLLGSLESATAVRESLALAYWERVVGPQAAAATEPESVRDGVLFVRTKSSVWSHELTFLKAHILTELNRRIGRPVIKEIIFRAQGVR